MDEVPGDVLAFISFTGEGYRNQLEQVTPAQRRMLEQFEQMLGVSVEELTSVLEGEAALYVRPGVPIPEVTLVVKNDDEQRALRVLDKVARRAAALGGAPPRTSEADGVRIKTLPLGPISVNYGAFDGKVVVTTSTAAVKSLRANDARLADDPDFEQARQAAGMPEQTLGFAYIDVEDTVPLLDGLARLAGEETIPQEALANLRPVRSIVFFSEGAAEEGVFRAFVEIE